MIFFSISESYYFLLQISTPVLAILPDLFLLRGAISKTTSVSLVSIPSQDSKWVTDRLCWLSISQKLWQVSAKIMFVQTLYKNLGAIEYRQFEISITTTCISIQYQLYLQQRWQPAKFKTFPSETSYDPSSAVHIYDYLISIRIRCVMLFYLASMVSEIGKFWSTANIY